MTYSFTLKLIRSTTSALSNAVVYISRVLTEMHELSNLQKGIINHLEGLAKSENQDRIWRIKQRLLCLCCVSLLTWPALTCMAKRHNYVSAITDKLQHWQGHRWKWMEIKEALQMSSIFIDNQTLVQHYYYAVLFWSDMWHGYFARGAPAVISTKNEGRWQT